MRKLTLFSNVEHVYPFFHLTLGFAGMTSSSSTKRQRSSKRSEGKMHASANDDGVEHVYVHAALNLTW